MENREKQKEERKEGDNGRNIRVRTDGKPVKIHTNHFLHIPSGSLRLGQISQILVLKSHLDDTFSFALLL
jgi:hypothetical protein